MTSTTTDTAESGSDPQIADLRKTIHELSNALTAVLANAQLAKAVLSPESGVGEEMEDVVAGARRAAELTRKLKEIAQALDQNRGETR